MRRVCGVSRKIERATYEAVPFRFIADNQHPNHDTQATDRAHAFLLIESYVLDEQRDSMDAGGRGR